MKFLVILFLFIISDYEVVITAFVEVESNEQKIKGQIFDADNFRRWFAILL